MHKNEKEIIGLFKREQELFQENIQKDKQLI